MADEVYPGKLGIKKNTSLSGPDSEKEAAMAARVEKDPDGYVGKYLQAHKNVIDVDRARKLFGDYDQSKESRSRLSEVVHEPASAIAKAAYSKILERPSDPAKPVVFVTGAGGSGKSFVIDEALKQKVHTIYDTQMVRLEGSIDKVNQALEAGKNVVIYDIVRPPELAFVGVIDRAVEMGRIIPIPALAANHAQAQETFLKLYEEYSNNDRVEFYIVDNPGGSQDIQPISIDELREREREDAPAIEAKLRQVLDNEFDRRRGTGSELSEEQYSAFRGDSAGRAAQEPGAGQGDIRQGQGGDRVADERQPEEQGRPARERQAQAGAVERPAPAQAGQVQEQSASGDAQTNQGTNRGGVGAAAQPVHGAAQVRAAESQTQGAGRDARTHGLEGSKVGRLEGSKGDSEAEGRFRKALANPRAPAEYDRLFGPELGIDNIKELSPDYAASNDSRAKLSGVVQQPATEFADQMFDRRVQTPAPPGKEELVVFTAGGTGSGKTSTIRNAIDSSPLLSGAKLIYDGTLSDYDDATKKIDAALRAGSRVVVIGVYRDPIDAFRNGVLPRAVTQGRIVPADYHAKSHLGAAETMKRLIEKYGKSDNVEFLAIDNSKGPGKAVLSEPSVFDKSAGEKNAAGAGGEQNGRAETGRLGTAPDQVSGRGGAGGPGSDAGSAAQPSV